MGGLRRSHVCGFTSYVSVMHLTRMLFNPTERGKFAELAPHAYAYDQVQEQSVMGHIPRVNGTRDAVC